MTVTASTFYTAYVLFIAFECTSYTTISTLLSLAWRQAKGKRRSDFLVWLTPLVVGSMVATVLAFIILFRLLFRLRLTVGGYVFEWTVQTVLIFINIYGTLRLWQVLRNSPIFPGPLPQTEEAAPSSEIWPPPPTQRFS